jgi:hypothetical protein
MSSPKLPPLPKTPTQKTLAAAAKHEARLGGKKK